MGKVKQNVKPEKDVNVTDNANSESVMPERPDIVNRENGSPSPSTSTNHGIPQISQQMVSYPQIGQVHYTESLKLIFNNQINNLVSDFSLSNSTQANVSQMIDLLRNLVSNYRPWKDDLVLLNPIGNLGSGMHLFDSNLHLVLILAQKRYPGDAQKRKSRYISDLRVIKFIIESGLKIKIPDAEVEEVNSQGVLTPIVQIDLASLVNSDQQALSDDIKYNNRKLTISINQRTGLAQCSLFTFLIKFDYRFCELTMIFLYWAKQNGFVIDEISTNANRLSSYALNWMVVHFLQVAAVPPIFPSIEQIVTIGRHDCRQKPLDILDYPNKVDIFEKYDVNEIKSRIGLLKNVQSTDELLPRLFEYYAFEFDYFNFIIDPRVGDLVDKPIRVETISIIDPVAIGRELVNQEANDCFVKLFRSELTNFLENLCDNNENKPQTVDYRQINSQNTSPDIAQVIESMDICPQKVLLHTQLEGMILADASSTQNAQINTPQPSSVPKSITTQSVSQFTLDHRVASYREINSNIYRFLQSASDEAQVGDIVDQLSILTEESEMLHKIKNILEHSLGMQQPFQKEKPNVHEIGTIGANVGMYNSDLHFVVLSSKVSTVPKISEALQNIPKNMGKTLNRLIPCRVITENDKSIRGETIPALQLDLIDLSDQNGPISNLAGRKMLITFNQMAGLYQSGLIRFLNKYDHRFRWLNTIVLHWAKQNDFSQCESLSCTNSLSSYGLTQMVIFFLQVTKPAILPPIFKIQQMGRKLGYKPKQIKGDTDQFEVYDFDQFDVDNVKALIGPSANTDTLNQLIIGFGDFYTYQFRYDRHVVCTRLGKMNTVKAHLIRNRRRTFPNDQLLARKFSSQLIIEDPVMINCNLGFGLRFVNMFRPKLESFYLGYKRDKAILTYNANPKSRCRSLEKKCFANQNLPFYDIYTDGSKNKEVTGCAFVVCEALKDKKICHSGSYRLSNECTVLQAELLAIRIAIEWCMTTGKNCTIHTDCEKALEVIADDNCQDETRLAEEIRKKLRLYNFHLCLRWIKSHIDLDGNEEADHLAKDATRHETVDYILTQNGTLEKAPESTKRICTTLSKESVKKETKQIEQINVNNPNSFVPEVMFMEVSEDAFVPNEIEPEEDVVSIKSDSEFVKESTEIVDNEVDGTDSANDNFEDALSQHDFDDLSLQEDETKTKFDEEVDKFVENAIKIDAIEANQVTLTNTISTDESAAVKTDTIETNQVTEPNSTSKEAIEANQVTEANTSSTDESSTVETVAISKKKKKKKSKKKVVASVKSTPETNAFDLTAEVQDETFEVPERFDPDAWREPIFLNIGNSEIYSYSSQLNVDKEMVANRKLEFAHFQQLFTNYDPRSLLSGRSFQEIINNSFMSQSDVLGIIEIFKYVAGMLKLSTSYYKKEFNVFEIGSIGCKFGVPNSDVHLMLYSEMDADVFPLNYFCQDKNVFKRRKEAHIEELKKIVTILACRLKRPLAYRIEMQQSNRGMQLPVLQMNLADLGNPDSIRGDNYVSRKLTISFNEVNAHAQTELMHFLTKYDTRFQELTAILLYYLKAVGLVAEESLTSSNSLSSYSIGCLVAYFLMVTEDPILPSIEKLNSANVGIDSCDPLILNNYPYELPFIGPYNINSIKAHIVPSANVKKISHLFENLADFYAYRFDFNENAICPFSGKANVSKKALYEAKLSPMKEGANRFLTSMVIEDPLMLNCNLVYQQSKSFVSSFKQQMSKLYLFLLNFSNGKPGMLSELDYQLATYREIDQNVLYESNDQIVKFVEDNVALSHSEASEIGQFESFLCNIVSMYDNYMIYFKEVGSVGAHLGMYNSGVHFVLCFNRHNNLYTMFGYDLKGKDPFPDLKKVHEIFENRFQKSIPHKIFTPDRTNRGLSTEVMQFDMADLAWDQDQRGEARKSRKVTISINQTISFAQMSMLQLLVKYDQRFQQLVLAFLPWAKNSGLVAEESLSTDACLSTYSAIWMVAFFLQLIKILPPIEKIQSIGRRHPGFQTLSLDGRVQLECFENCDLDDVKWQIRQRIINESVKSLLVDLFRFYIKFDYFEKMICLRSGEIKKKPRNLNKKTLIIMDPIDNNCKLEDRDSKFVDRMTKAMDKFMSSLMVAKLRPNMAEEVV